ncbi:MAG: cbb3-type cytochrome oxidase assembly protein CcoS [Marinomonas sp.]|jgi:cbb3-type cytochrome oxidase maturation protein|uniref:Cbb3-type cytochrome oxidase maturation protein n=1 Tax=Marinomonas communis TaxID=28254 RepID=A0A4R6XHK1_9GAMM|nr:cbb3-type cytochrome oxidase assembly protein CcoS [Marinomonas communis]RUM50460.1 MAG: cbb3-type cytochrome oxidase assembly protein CcoS [Marinomonas sp.]TDR15348.1 cbb3-type cytochrome oxidase maturation protein [Marinomonas communis]
MESLFLLIPIAGIFVVIAILIFIWAVKGDQFDDLNREGERILFDDDETDMKQ